MLGGCTTDEGYLSKGEDWGIWYIFGVMQPMRDGEVVVYGRASAVCCLDVLFGSSGSWY